MKKPTPMQRAPSELSPRQELAWLVMAAVTIIGMAAGMREFFNVDFTQPHVVVIYCIAMFAIVYVERKFIRDNSTHDGMPKRDDTEK